MSELEGVVLGIIRQSEPCTAYAVRSALQASPSSFWSASTGSIYPLLRRLEGAGLVKGIDDPEDRRGRRLLRSTKAGQQTHADWMKAAASLEVAAAVSDPIRSRAFFLGQLADEDRRTFVENSMHSLEQFLAVARADLEARRNAPDPYACWAALGAVYQAEARVQWMRELRDRTSNNRPE